MPVGNLTIRNLLGVNLNSMDADLKDNELAWAKNVYEGKRGEFYSRLNSKVQPSSVTFLDASPETFVDLHFFRHDSLVSGFAYIAKSGNLPAIKHFTDPTLNWAGPTSTPQAGSASRFDRPAYLTHLDKTYIFNGQGRGFVITHGVDAVTELTYLENVRPTVACKFRGQFAFAGFGSPQKNAIKFSEIELPETILPDEKMLLIGDSEERIIELVEVTIEGGDQYFEPYLLVLKERSVWMVQGDPPTELDLGSVRVFPLIRDEGCVGKGTVIETTHGVVWCSGKNVFIAPPGDKPIRVGNNIKPLLESCDKTKPWQWHAEFFNGVYRLTVPKAFYPETIYVPAPGTPAYVGPSETSYIANEQWWLDLDNFSEAREGEERFKWWGPMTVPSGGMAVLPATVSTPERLMSVLELRGYYTEFGTVNRIDQFSIEELDVETATGRDHDGAVSNALPVVYADMEIRFKAFDFGDQTARKLLQAVESSYSYSGTEKPEVTVETGSTRATFPISSEVGAAGFVLDVASLDFALLGEGIKVVGYRPPGGLRLAGFSLQPTFKLHSTGRARFRSLTIRIRPIASRPR